MQPGLAWECACGNIIYAEESPEECNKCSALDSFMQIPEEILKSREEDMMEEMPAKVSKVKSKTAKKARKKK